MTLQPGLPLLVSSLWLVLLPACSVGPLTGAPCEGSRPNCPSGQRCVPPLTADEAWGRCEAPALELSVSSPVDNAQRTPPTVPITFGACPTFSSTAVDVAGDWDITEACMDEEVLESLNRLLVPGCNVDVLQPSGWMAGGVGFGDTAAVRGMAWGIDYQLRLTSRPGGVGGTCEPSACESRVLPLDGFSARCKTNDSGTECACDVWFDSTDSLSATWTRGEGGIVLTSSQGAEERYLVAEEGEEGLRIRRVAQPGGGAVLQGAFTLKLGRAR
jgi:hypothetical protein